MAVYLKDPQAVLDYSVNWTDALAPDQTVLSCAWSISPVETAGLALQGSPSLADGLATAVVSGGILGHVYALTCRATFNDGDVDDKSWTIRIGEQ